MAEINNTAIAIMLLIFGRSFTFNNSKPVISILLTVGQSHFCFDLPSVVYDMRARKSDLRYRDHSNPFCRMISHFKCLSSEYGNFSLCLDNVDTIVIIVVLYLYLVKLFPPLSDVLFFFFVVVLQL